VSFNIEPFSSLLLGRPAGPVRILFQQSLGKPLYTWREPGDRFQRIVYHPHGLVTADCVMTTSQYEANRESLAFALAIHAAFGNTLVIVGMSLNDAYLREQIQEFRRSLGDVYWFDSTFPPDLVRWASRHEITMVPVDWPDFWNVTASLPVNIDVSDLCSAWYLAVNEATEEAEGGSLGALQRSLPDESQSSDLARLARRMARAGKDSGESGKARTVRGREPRDIELAVRQRLIDAGIPIPALAKLYAPSS
jgi:hypothetical protein